MTLPPATAERLRFLARIAEKEARHLIQTAHRLSAIPFTPERVAELEDSLDLAERVDAFVGRFGRVQDTIGDKLLPVLLAALGERLAAVIDNLDRTERLSLIPSAEHWMKLRKLRNQTVYDYMEDPRVLAEALQSANAFVPVLIGTLSRLQGEIARRGWA